jgi:hypothetical protein
LTQEFSLGFGQHLGDAFPGPSSVSTIGRSASATLCKRASADLLMRATFDAPMGTTLLALALAFALVADRIDMVPTYLLRALRWW